MLTLTLNKAKAPKKSFTSWSWKFVLIVEKLMEYNLFNVVKTGPKSETR